MLTLSFGFFLSLGFTYSQKSYDSLNIKVAKHYFNTTLVFDAYFKPKQAMDTTNNPIAKKLETYGIKQNNLSFQIPVFTKDIKGTGKDSNVIANKHLMITGTFMTLKPIFEGIKQHTLKKRGIGIRYIYNTGKKSVWFFDAAPFVTRDITYLSKPFFRLASTIIFSHNVNQKFNFRIGATKSFLWGNRLYLPFIGFRIGALDKINLSIQFPRNITINLPINRKITVGIYTKPQGGVFNFSNHDTIYFRRGFGTFHFTRYEINTGLRLDVRSGSFFNFYLATGLSTSNHVIFYSDYANSTQKQISYNKYFFIRSLPPTVYLNFGLVFKVGKTRSYYNNTNIYDAIDLNNIYSGNGNAQIPVKTERQVKDPNIEAIKDLIDYNDF